jgi:hypothetical protein
MNKATLLHYVVQTRKKQIGSRQFIDYYKLNEKYAAGGRFIEMAGMGLMKAQKTDDGASVFSVTVKGLKYLADNKGEVLDRKSFIAETNKLRGSSKKTSIAMTPQAKGAVFQFAAALEEGQQAIATVQQMVNIGQAFLNGLNKGESNEQHKE